MRIPIFFAAFTGDIFRYALLKVLRLIAGGNHVFSLVFMQQPWHASLSQPPPIPFYLPSQIFEVKLKLSTGRPSPYSRGGDYRHRIFAELVTWHAPCHRKIFTVSFLQPSFNLLASGAEEVPSRENILPFILVAD
jgi:hypothetical protein